MAFLKLSSILDADKSHLKGDDLDRSMYASSNNTEKIITLGDITAKQLAIYNAWNYEDCLLEGGVSSFGNYLREIMQESDVMNYLTSDEHDLEVLSGNISFLLALESKFNGGLDKPRLWKVVLDFLNERDEDDDILNKESFDDFISKLTTLAMLEKINGSAFSDIFADNVEEEGTLVVTYNRGGNGECGLSSYIMSSKLNLHGLNEYNYTYNYAFNTKVCDFIIFMYALIRLANDMYRGGRLEELFNMSNEEVFNKVCNSYLNSEAEGFDSSIDYDEFLSYAEWAFSNDISDVIDLFLGRGIEAVESNLREAQDEFVSESDDFSSILSNGSKLFFPNADEELLSLTYKIKCRVDSLFFIFKEETELIDDKVLFHFDFSNMYKLLSRFYGNKKGNYFVECEVDGFKCRIENPVFAFKTNAVRRLLGGSGYDDLGEKYSINVSLKFKSQSL
jgi:hypothetical protein